MGRHHVTEFTFCDLRRSLHRLITPVCLDYTWSNGLSSIKKNVLNRKCIQCIHKTIVFAILSANKCTKFHTPSVVIGNIGLFAYVLYFLTDPHCCGCMSAGE